YTTLFRSHFQIADGRHAARAPVDDIFTTVNESLFMEPDKNLAHRRAQAFIHGEVFARPIHRDAEALHLRQDGAAVMLPPLPHPLDELFAAQRAPLHTFTRQLALHHHLGGDAGVVGAWDPQ